MVATSEHSGRGLRATSTAAALLALLALSSCAPAGAPGAAGSTQSAGPSSPPLSSHSAPPPAPPTPTPSDAPAVGETPAASGPEQGAPAPASGYPLHTGIVSTTFWVGEIFDPNASDGSQMISTYDGEWFQNYGGCDGISTGGRCDTEPRTAGNDYFPSAFTPGLNPFYLDLPFDDVNDPAAFARRADVIPWADAAEYRGQLQNAGISLMLNRWVRLVKGDRVCYGQIADAGPGLYNDAEYVFGSDDARPANREFNGAGMDVSPALNGCLAFSELNGQDDRVDWQFVEEAEVPPGPWLRVVSRGHAVNW